MHDKYNGVFVPT